MQHSTIHLIILSLALSACCAMGSLAAQEALSTGNTESQRAYDQMLLAISRGNIQAIQLTDLEHFVSPLGRIDAQDPQLIRRRQQDLRDSLKRLNQEQQQAALNLLDHKARDYYLSNDRQINGLSYFLPAPFAAEQLQAAADYWFDHGEFNDYLQVQYLLEQYIDQPTNDKRMDVAQALLGNQFTLYRPGLLIAEQGPIIDHSLGQSVHWNVHNAYLHACDPWLDVLWQRPLGRYAEIQTGPMHVLIKDKHGFTIINHQGHSHSLPPISQASSLSISAHHAWFSIGKQIFAYDLKKHNVTNFELPELPMAAPLDDGQQSIWLTRHHLYFISKENNYRLKHGLVVNKQWKLQLDGSHIYLTGPDASYRIKSYRESIKQDQTATLIASGQTQRAWQHSKQRAQYIEDWLAAPIDFIATHHQELMALPLNEHQTIYLQHRLQRVGKGGVDSQALAELIQSDSTYVLPMGEDDYLSTSEHYSHAISIVGLYHKLRTPSKSNIPKLISAGTQLIKSEHIAKPKDPSFSFRYAAQLQQSGDVLVTAHDDKGQLLWRHHIPKFGFHPSVSFIVRPAHLIVTLGISRCLVFDTYSGDLLANSDMPASFNDPKYIHLHQKHYLCSSGPTGIRNKIVIHKPLGEQTHNQVFEIDTAIRWMLPIGKDILYSNGKQAYRLRDQVAIHLPEALIKADSVELHQRGLISGDRLYPWH